MQLWVYWPQCEATLERLQDEAHRIASHSWCPACGSSLHWPVSSAAYGNHIGCSAA